MLRRFLPIPVLVSLVLCGSVLVMVLLFWRAGYLQFFELELYDLIARARASPAAPSNNIMIVGITDDDMARYGWPLDDATLARLLDRLAECGPRAVGIDLFRDLPEPRSGEGRAQLEETLLAHPHVICIHNPGAGIPPPPILAERPERIGFSALPADGMNRKIVRRGLLYMDTGSGNAPSLSFQLALLFLQAEGVLPEPAGPDQAEWLRWGKAVLRPFESNDGPYVNADAGGYQFLIRFKDPSAFPRYSLHDLLTGHFRADLFRNKVALVGITATSVKDYIQTPLQPDQFGVDVHATVVDQLIESALSGNRPLRYWSEWHEALWMVVWGLAAGALGYHLRSPWHFAQALLAGAFALAAAYWFAFNSGWWIPVVAPAIAFFPAAALVTSYAAYEEHRQHDTLMRLFSWHVSPEIARALWKQRDQLMDGQRPRAQQLTATVLFTDIQGFSIISERMAPAQLFDWLNEYLQQMTGAIVDHHGVIRQFAGDAIIAIFGVPVPRRVADEIRQDARNAVRCALAMRNELARLNEQWERRRLPTISLRAGLFTGPLAAGSIGSSDRLEYAVIGDTVNTAARLESFNKEVANPDHSPDRIRILVGESTNDLLGEEFETKPMGSLRVKGKEKEVVVYQILGETKPLSHST